MINTVYSKETISDEIHTKWAGVILCVIAMGLYAILNFIEKHAQKW